MRLGIVRPCQSARQAATQKQTLTVYYGLQWFIHGGNHKGLAYKLKGTYRINFDQKLVKKYSLRPLFFPVRGYGLHQRSQSGL